MVEKRYKHGELHINLLRPITAKTGELRCEGESLYIGRSIAAAGKLYSHGTTTCMITRGKAEG